jgi:hypothetical protein
LYLHDKDFYYQLLDCYDIGMRYAPNYMREQERSSFNDEGELRVMQTHKKKILPVYPAVIIREDIASEYGDEIRTASQYIELLEWLKAKNPDSIPGVAVPMTPYVSGFKMPHDFFMPEWGYWNGTGKWEWSVLDIQTNDARAVYSAPEVGRALEEFIDLWRNGLLYMRTYGFDREFSEFPTALIYFYDFIDMFPQRAYLNGFQGLDASLYRIYALYNGKMPLYINPDGETYSISCTEAVAPPAADPTEFLRFLEWLGERENYQALMYGEEGRDYTLENNRITPVEEQAETFAVHRRNLFFLERNELNAISSDAPWNYETEMYSLKPAYTLYPTYDDEETLSLFYEKYGMENFMRIYDTSDDYNLLYSKLFRRSDKAPDKDETLELIDEFMEKQWDKVEILDYYAKAIGDMLKSAAERNR